MLENASQCLVLSSVLLTALQFSYTYMLPMSPQVGSLASLHVKYYIASQYMYRHGVSITQSATLNLTLNTKWSIRLFKISFTQNRDVPDESKHTEWLIKT